MYMQFVWVIIHLSSTALYRYSLFSPAISIYQSFNWTESHRCMLQFYSYFPIFPRCLADRKLVITRYQGNCANIYRLSRLKNVQKKFDYFRWQVCSGVVQIYVCKLRNWQSLIQFIESIDISIHKISIHNCGNNLNVTNLKGAFQLWAEKKVRLIFV